MMMMTLTVTTEQTSRSTGQWSVVTGPLQHAGQASPAPSVLTVRCADAVAAAASVWFK